MNTAEIQILDAGATKALDELHAKVGPGNRRPFMHKLGSAAGDIYRDHLSAREASSPNKQGFPRQHFWSRLRSATAYDESRTTDDTAAIVIADRAINAKLFGGTWGPRPPKKMLAIPLRGEAYGTQPSSGLIPNLFLFRPKKGGVYLAKKDGDKITAFYRLVPRVTVPADPDTLPDQAAVGASLLQTARNFIFRNP